MIPAKCAVGLANNIHYRNVLYTKNLSISAIQICFNLKLLFALFYGNFRYSAKLLHHCLITASLYILTLNWLNLKLLYALFYVNFRYSVKLLHKAVVSITIGAHSLLSINLVSLCGQVTQCIS